MQINGTLINYYFHCKKQCYLYANRINLEDNSEDVRIGKVLHEIKEDSNTELKFDNIAVDKFTKDYLIEYKKSDSDVEAVKWQVVLYLYKLKQKEIYKKGKIEFFEKNNTKKNPEIIELDEKLENELENILEEIKDLINQKESPKAIFNPKCKKCAYYEYCFI